MRLLIQLFWNFLLIGFFGIGSAYISIPLLYDRIVVANKWLQPGLFSDLLSLCRMLPGPTEINMAAFVGYGSVSQQLGAGMGLLGVLTAMAAMATVSFVLMFPTLRLFADKEANAMAQSIMESLRPVTAGMMMAFLILLFNVENFGHPYLLKWDFVSSIFLFVATLLGVHYFRFNPIFILLLCGLAGIFLY